MYTELDEVRVYGKIATVEKVIYDIVDGKKTDNVYCYEMKIDGVSGYLIYPDEIEQ